MPRVSFVHGSVSNWIPEYEIVSPPFPRGGRLPFKKKHAKEVESNFDGLAHAHYRVPIAFSTVVREFLSKENSFKIEKYTNTFNMIVLAFH